MAFVGKTIHFLRDQVPAYSDLPDPECAVPMNDTAAWEQYPHHRWVYNKLELAGQLGIPCGPFGIAPGQFPVCLKPVINLRGCGRGNHIVQNAGEYDRLGEPGMFWMTAAGGEHLSHDFAVVQGEVVWSGCFRGHPFSQGMFDYWETVPAPPALESRLRAFVEKTLSVPVPFTGICNIETIGDTVIECHLRMGDSFKAGNRAFMQSVIQLYRQGTWDFTGSLGSLFLFVLFGPQDQKYTFPEHVWAMVSRQCICAHRTAEEARRKFPVGGGRIAILGTREPEKGLALRQHLIEHIEPTLPEEYVLPLATGVATQTTATQTPHRSHACSTVAR